MNIKWRGPFSNPVLGTITVPESTDMELVQQAPSAAAPLSTAAINNANVTPGPGTFQIPVLNPATTVYYYRFISTLATVP